MLILNSRGEGSSSHVVLLFGVGQIGHYILQGLEKLGFEQNRQAPFAWSDFEQQSRDASAIHEVLGSSSFDFHSISLVWSAGVCGFHSTEADVEQEFRSFQQVLSLYEALQQSHPDISMDFHLVSSAGGLFEGQTVIGEASPTTPKRPYGHLKKRQEQAAVEGIGRQNLLIYRPSSVYGPMVQDVHRGLINNLVKNARNGRYTVLDAHVMSLRDYVYAGDIGHYIARQVVEGGAGIGSEVRFLVSGRCSPIFEVVRKIRRLLHTNVYFRLDESFGNHGHITFNPDVMPPGWHPVTLDYGIRQFALVD